MLNVDTTSMKSMVIIFSIRWVTFVPLSLFRYLRLALLCYKLDNSISIYLALTTSGNTLKTMSYQQPVFSVNVRVYKPIWTA